MSNLEILIVDDNEADHFLCEYTIERYGANITIHKAYDGQEALDFIASYQGRLDFIFLDINMPRMNGFEFLEAYQVFYSDHSAVIIMLTSSIKDSDSEKCLVYPQVKHFISKPLSPENLHDCFLLNAASPPLVKTIADKPFGSGDSFIGY